MKMVLLNATQEQSSFPVINKDGNIGILYNFSLRLIWKSSQLDELVCNFQIPMAHFISVDGTDNWI